MLSYIVFFIIALILSAVRGSSSLGGSNLFQGTNVEFALEDTPKKSNNSLVPLVIILAILAVLTFTISPLAGIILLSATTYSFIFVINNEKDTNATKRRKEALRRAGVFLAPYRDIWKNLTLSNKYCSLKLRADGKTIAGFEKKSDPNEPYRTFRVLNSEVFDYNELWNLLCISFSYNKSYDGLLEDCSRYRASIYADVIIPTPALNEKTIPKPPRIDINNCSEAELTALPGISIVISKRIIKKREELGGFKSIEEFLTFIKLKPNVTEQLRQRICTNKMKGTLRITHNDERTIDL